VGRRRDCSGHLVSRFRAAGLESVAWLAFTCCTSSHRDVSAVISRAARIYTIRDWLLIAVCAALAFWSYRQAAELAKVDDPPSISFSPALALSWREPLQQRRGLAAKENYHVYVLMLVNGCHNPVKVIVEFVYPFGDRYWRAHRALLRRPGHIAFVTSQPNARNFHADAFALPLSGTQSGSVSEIQTVSGPDPFSGQPMRVAVRRIKYLPPIVTATVPWGPGYSHPSDTAREVGIGFRYLADAVRPRGYKSCYVVLPDSSGAGTSDVATNAQATLDDRDLPLTWSGGTVRVLAANGDPISGLNASASIPPPSSARDNRWECSFSTTRLCGSIAVLDESNASSDSENRLFVYGALLGLFLAGAFDALRRIRIPPPE
jgi:hypothetical protein